MKTVLILCPNISGIGGVEKVVIGLANNLCSISNVIIGILNDKPSSYMLDNKVSVQFLKKCKYSHFRIISHILRKMVKNNHIHLSTKMIKKIYYPKYRCKNFLEIVIQHNISTIIGIGIDMTIIATYIKEYLENINVIGWQHNEYKLYFEKPGKYYYGLADIFKDRFELINHNIVLTKTEVKEYKEKMDATSEYIYNPVQTYDLTEKFNNIESTNLLFVGRISKEQKGIDYLIEILDRALNDKYYKEWTATIVGDGPDYNFLKNELEKRGLLNRVKLTGSINNTALYYKQSSILLSTSRWEGFGVVIAEGFSFGLTVIAFENEGPKELINDCEDGYLVPKYNIDIFVNILKQTMSSVDDRKRIAKQAMCKSKIFSTKEIYNKWKKII